MRVSSMWFLGLVAIQLIVTLDGACQNRCNQNGICSKFSVCECFKGFTGPECSLRSCPVGSVIAAVAAYTDSVHDTKVTCSGRGLCDTATGNCQCFDGFTGSSCGQMTCLNSCSGRGVCVSLRTAATENDGYHFNRTTQYQQWDADLFHGCKCDQGYSGADCSERACAYGIDPRSSSDAHELITLVCECSPHCVGKFKLRIQGQTVPKFLLPTSTSTEVAAALTEVMGTFANDYTYSYDAVTTSNTTSHMICNRNTKTTTLFKFRKTTENVATISFYANLISGGSLNFETKQTLSCDCTANSGYDKICNGTFRLSFDGEMTDRLFSQGNSSVMISSLRAMKTIKAGVIAVINGSASPVCISGTRTNYSIVFQAQYGNVPQLQLWSSVVRDKGSPMYYSTVNTTNVLTLGKVGFSDDDVKLCNGIGKCDFTKSVCQCPFGWGPDGNLGPCGQLVVNESSWGGLARCPGVISPNGDATADLSMQKNYFRMYMSLNPFHGNGTTVSKIQYYPYTPSDAIGSFPPQINYSAVINFINMTSNVSAGPIVLDAAKQQLFFIDLNPNHSFIGLAPLATTNYNASLGTYIIWLELNTTVFGFTGDLHFNRRKLYWTTPGESLKEESNITALGEGLIADGSIHWAYMDSELPVQSYILTAAIGQQHLIDPMGIAIHQYKKKIFWVDKNISSTAINSSTCLRSCNFDGTSYSMVYLYRKVGNVTVSVNVTDLTIDFYHNDTALFVDTNFPNAIIAINLG